MQVVREEIFGPVVVAAPFRDVAEIPAIANDTVYGLAASVWTRTSRRRTGSQHGSAPAPCGSTAIRCSTQPADRRRA
ncbi:MAG: aldehyde dehydrogenase family protein [Steroidobacteraceae bacterium]